MKINIINNTQTSDKKVKYVIDFLFNRFSKSDIDITIVYGDIESLNRRKNLIHISENKPGSYSNFLSNIDIKKEVRASESIDIQFDLVDLTFSMLNELPNLVSSHTDAHGRNLPLDSVNYKYPVLDQIVEEIRLQLSTLNKLEIQYNKTSGTCSVSHDIDNIYAFDKPINILRALKRILSKGSMLFRLKSSLILFKDFILKRDPYYNFEFIINETRSNNMRSTFYFMVGGITRYDGRYNLADHIDLITRLREKKQIIGLHPSYDAGFDSSILSKEIKNFKKLTHIKCEHVRYHYLRYDSTSIAEDLDKYEILTDTSCGFASVIGFRNGTCYPFRKWIEDKECQSKTLYYPLAFMDTTALGYLSLNKNKLIEELKFIICQVSKYKGHFDLLWHNSNMYFYNNINEKELFKEAMKIMTSSLIPKEPIH